MNLTVLGWTVAGAAVAFVAAVLLGVLGEGLQI